jgi:probable blue pigment (indigoidine) exporter
MEATRLRDVLLTAFAPLAWGSTYVVTRQWLPPDIPLTGAAIRALPAGLLLLIVARQLPRGSWWWRTAVISTLTVGGFFVLIYITGQRLPSGMAAMLMASSAVAVLVMARLILGERAPTRKYLGGLAGIAGVALLVGGAGGGLDMIGVMASLLAMVSSSLGFVLTKLWQPPVAPVTFAAWQLTAGGLILAPVALAVEGTPPSLPVSSTVAFGYLILGGTAVAYVVWFHGLQRLPAGTVGLIGLLNPLSGVVLGALVAQEFLTGLQLLGAVAVLTGVAAGIDRSSRQAPDAMPSSSRQRPFTTAQHRGDISCLASTHPRSR